MIPRLLASVLHKMAAKYPVIMLTGPRQSGKTTLVQKTFKDYVYVNLENPQDRDFAINDPQGFLQQYTDKLIIDEAQYAPELFSYIQVIVDNSRKKGQFILTGSQNFLLYEKVAQSLAGRAAVVTLLPFSYRELKGSRYEKAGLNTFLYKGMYPVIYDAGLKPEHWYPSYINTYLERDVRSLMNITSLNDFQRFIKVCAARTGQIVNFSSIAAETGVTHTTIKKWISILESSYIVFLLKPYYRNFNKRLLKSPKLYFYDTGLVCSLLGITSDSQLEKHFIKGALFETFIMAELMKNAYNQFLHPALYYWRDNMGNELDCIIEKGDHFAVIEIKAGATIKESFFKSFSYFDKVRNDRPSEYYVIYGGNQNQKRSSAEVQGWREINV